MNATLKVLKSIAEILVIFENEEEQDFLSYEYSTYEYTIYIVHTVNLKIIATIYFCLFFYSKIKCVIPKIQ